MSAAICAACPHGGKGRDACAVSGRPIADHAAAGDCPAGHFTPAHRVGDVGDRRPPPPTGGPGTELRRVLSWFDDGCGTCSDRAALMDRWGSDECERRADVILGWMRTGAESRGLPFWPWLARGILRRAIGKARAAG